MNEVEEVYENVNNAIQYRKIEFVNSPRSFNNRLILEAYKTDRALKSTVTSGFAMVSQKILVKGLKVLIDTKLNDGTFIHKGCVAYVREEYLHTQPWAQKTLQSDAVEGDFIIVELAHVEFVVPK